MQLIFARSVFAILLVALCNNCVLFGQSKVTLTPEVPSDLPPHIETLQPGVTLRLLTEHPDLVTPTGIDVDEQGNIWVVACHTHFRPADYKGPEHDEVLVFDKDGKNRRVFYNQTVATMDLELGKDGWVYLAERDRILRVKDSDGDGRGDIEEDLANLETTADYSHNGLSGLAWHPNGDLVFSTGENFSKEWTLTARDGTGTNGRGEGGIFRCTENGKNLHRMARGFWNPFGILVRDDGEMFAAENDPGNRPPCRLLNVVEGADYGYQRAYGTAPIHPFVAWNGELRGTLGMVHPSGEGPCAIVELGGGVLIPSWSNHCIDYYPLHRKGAGYASERMELLRGGDFFRPVCMAPGPDNSFYFTDWVFSSYELHGRGRLWKLEIDHALASWMKKSRDPMNTESIEAAEMRSGNSKRSIDQLLHNARSKDQYLSDAALSALARLSDGWTVETLTSMSAEDRLWALVALRRVDLTNETWVRALFDDPDPAIRFECLRWISDGVCTGFLGDIEKMLEQKDLTYELFEAALAAFNTLRGEPESGVTDTRILLNRIISPDCPFRMKAYALRLMPASDEQLTVSLLKELLANDDPILSLEVVRTLALKKSSDAMELLVGLASDETKPVGMRAEAIAGLASAQAQEHDEILLMFSSDKDASIRDEALRALRSRKLNELKKAALREVGNRHGDSLDYVNAILDGASVHRGRPDLDQAETWLSRLDSLPSQPDLSAGRRIFLHSKVAQCASCHRYDGRGSVVGPDLSLIAKQGDRLSILRSILEPNREVAPQFYTTVLELEDGNVFSGILLRSSNVEVFRDNLGKERTFSRADIVQRKELKSSMMPTGLVEQLTDRELRDLVAFLTSGDTGFVP